MRFAPPTSATFLAVTLALAGCSSTERADRLNPLDWFSQGSDEAGGAEEETPEPQVAPVDDRPLFGRVTDVKLEPTRFGAILRVEAAIPIAASSQPALRPGGDGDPDAAGLLTFDLVGDFARGGSLSLNRLVFGRELGETVPDEPVVTEEKTVSVATFIGRETLRSAQTLVVRSENGSASIDIR